MGTLLLNTILGISSIFFCIFTVSMFLNPFICQNTLKSGRGVIIIIITSAKGRPLLDIKVDTRS